jgi:hypothetical protein
MEMIHGLPSPETVFQLHPDIRWTAFARNGYVVFCQMRSGVKSYTSTATDRSFMEIGPLILTGVSERMSPSGRIESIVINFEKDSVLLTEFKGGYLAVSVDRFRAPAVLQEIEVRIKTLLG